MSQIERMQRCAAMGIPFHADPEQAKEMAAELDARQSEAVGITTLDFKAHACTGVKWLGVVPAEGTPLYTSPTPAMRAAYEKGWHAAARWAERDDLHADVDSPSYTNERDAVLAEVAKMLETTNGR